MASDENQMQNVEETADQSELRVYELAFHIDAELPQEEAKKTYQSLKDSITSNKGDIVAEGEIEKIQLAYTISRMDTTGRRDFNSAYFGWISFEIDGAGHDAVLASIKSESRIIRFLDLRTTKDAAKHAAEMHEFYRRAPEPQEAVDEDAVADVELDAVLKEAGV